MKERQWKQKIIKRKVHGSFLPGDPAGLHETGWISSSLADGRVAAWAAPGSVVIRAAQAVPVPVGVRRVRWLRSDERPSHSCLVLTWSCSACYAATGSCWGLCPWRWPSAMMNSRCSTSCFAAGCYFCFETRLSSFPTGACGAPGMPTGSCGAAEPGWSADVVWRSVHFLSCSAKNKEKQVIYYITHSFIDSWFSAAAQSWAHCHGDLLELLSPVIGSK